ncbi:MAG: DUF2341 domain-containing protein, partial [Candidatus Woesearchaeota archaeon]
ADAETSLDFHADSIPDDDIQIIDAEYYTAEDTSYDCCYTYVGDVETQCIDTGSPGGSEACGPSMLEAKCAAANESVNQTFCADAYTTSSDTDYVRANVSIPRKYDPDCLLYQLVVCESPGGCRKELNQALSIGSNYTAAAGGDGCDLDYLPAVMLRTPADANTTNVNNVSLMCRVEDTQGIKNVTVYTNVSGSWSANQTIFPYGKNLLGSNSRFEYPLPANHYGNETWWQCVGTCAQNSTYSISGTSSMQVTNGGYIRRWMAPGYDSGGVNTNTTTIEVGKTYTLSYWARSNLSSGSYNLAYIFDVTGVATPVTGTISGNTDWTLYSYTFTVSGITGDPEIRLPWPNSAVGNVWIDDVQLEEGAIRTEHVENSPYLLVDIDGACSIEEECMSAANNIVVTQHKNNWTYVSPSVLNIDNDYYYCSNNCMLNFTLSNITEDGTYRWVVWAREVASGAVLQISKDGQNWVDWSGSTGLMLFGGLNVTVENGILGPLYVRMIGGTSSSHLDAIYLIPYHLKEYNASLNLNSLADGNYKWNCLATDNSSQENFAPANYTFTIDTNTAPVVTLQSPASASYDDDGSVLFNCSATDDGTLDTAVLYTNYTGSWAPNGSMALSGSSDWANFTSIFPLNKTIVWNCLINDTGGMEAWAGTNNTLIILHDFPPTVNLNSPADSQIIYTSSADYMCNATDEYGITNITLYSNTSGTWAQRETRWVGEPTATSSSIIIYHFNNESAYGENGSVIHDFSGNGLDGQSGFGSCSESWVDTPLGKGMLLEEGSGCTALTSPNSDLYGSTGNLTLEAWINLNDNTSNSLILNKHIDASANMTFRLYYASASSALSFQVGQSDLTLQGGTFADTTLAENTWYHVVARANGTELNVFVNGVKSSDSYAYDGTIYDASSMLVIGPYTTLSGSYMTIDEAATYNQPLSDAEILAHYNYGAKEYSINFTESGLGQGNYLWSCLAADTTDNLAYAAVNRTYSIDIEAPNVQFELPSPANQSTIPTSTQMINVSTGENVSSCTLTWLGTGATWWNSSFLAREEINITNNQASAITNFPAYVHIAKKSAMQSTYADLRIVNGSCGSGQTTLLAYEIEKGNSTGAELWVRFPNFAVGKNTVCVYYGNEFASSGENVTGVWDSNYLTVQHLDETSGTHEDSSSNNKDGTNVGSTQNAAGKIDGANSFDGVNDYVNFTQVMSGNVATYGGWFYFNSLTCPGGYCVPVQQAPATDNGYEMYTAGSTNIYCFDGATETAAKAFSISTWFHAMCVHTGTNMYLYVNGVPTAARATTRNVQATSFVIGGGAQQNTYWFNGSIDDIRVSNVARSTAYIAMSYQIVANQATLVSVDTEETLYSMELHNDSANTWANYTLTGLTTGFYDFDVTCMDLGGLTGTSEQRTVNVNYLPTVQSVSLTPTSPNTTVQLNCTFNITDADNATFTANYTWWNGTTAAITGSTAVSSGVNTSIYLGAGNTTKGETWKCEIKGYDGYTYSAGTNSTGRTIINTVPTTPTLLFPSNGNTTIRNRSMNINWTDSTDADADSITYILNVTTDAGYSCGVEINTNGITTSNYTPTTDLCVSVPYNWTVTPYDGEAYGTATAIWNFTIQEYLSADLTDNETSFGSIALLQTKNSTAEGVNDPMVIENVGNIPGNITIHATDSLWVAQPLNTSYFQFRIWNTSETGSFDWATAHTTFTPVNDTSALGAVNLSYVDTNDEARIDYEITVPTSEPAGNKITSMVVMLE